MMLKKMQEYSNSGPGQQQVLADMGRLAGSVEAVATIAENPDADSSPEQRQARILRAAAKLSDALPGVEARLAKLRSETEAGFEAAFVQNSGLTTPQTASEIRAHLKALKDPADRSVFLQELVKNADDAGLGSVLFAPPYLSGLDNVTHSRLKEQIEIQRLPDLHKNREVFAELSGNLQTALHEAGRAAHELGNPSKLDSIERRAKAATEAEARLAQGTLPGGV